MKSKIQKKLASKITGSSSKKVRLVPARMDDIKEAITRADVKSLIKDGAIIVDKARGVSRGRAKKKQKQRSRGRMRGQGSRKGRQGARSPGKKTWMTKIRVQRSFLKDLRTRNKIDHEIYKDLYKKSKGGFFRSKRHIKLYITEHKLIK